MLLALQQFSSILISHIVYKISKVGQTQRKPFKETAIRRIDIERWRRSWVSCHADYATTSTCFVILHLRFYFHPIAKKNNYTCCIRTRNTHALNRVPICDICTKQSTAWGAQASNTDLMTAAICSPAGKPRARVKEWAPVV